MLLLFDYNFLPADFQPSLHNDVVLDHVHLGYSCQCQGGHAVYVPSKSKPRIVERAIIIQGG